MQKEHSAALPLSENLKHLARGDYRRVYDAAIRVLSSAPRNPVALFLLGVIARDHRNYAKALDLFDRAHQAAPDDATYLAHKGQVLSVLGRVEDARAVADKASQLSVTDAYTADTIGVLFSRTGFHEKATPFFARAIRLNPSVANFHYNLGSSLQFCGHFDEARQAYGTAIEKKPDFFRAYSSLVGLGRQTEESNLLKKMTDLFEANSTDPSAALHLGHAIAKTLEDLGRFEESFDWLVRAKRLKRNALTYEVNNDIAFFEAAKATLDPVQPAACRDKSSCSDPKLTPIFIIGLPRTGTTLVDRILSSHSRIVSAGELSTFSALVKAGAKTPSNLVLDARTLHAANNDCDLTDIGKRYVEEIENLSRGATFVTDKMPLNFFYAGLIFRAIPHARIIALRRNAMDSCLSNFRQLFSTEYSYYNYTYDIQDTARFYVAFDDLMTHWRKALPESHFTEVHYEDIVLNQEWETRRLLNFCGLEWDEKCMDFHKNNSPVSTASSVQVRQPLYHGAIDRWRKYGPKLDKLKAALAAYAR